MRPEDIGLASFYYGGMPEDSDEDTGAVGLRTHTNSGERNPDPLLVFLGALAVLVLGVSVLLWGVWA